MIHTYNDTVQFFSCEDVVYLVLGKTKVNTKHSI